MKKITKILPLALAMMLCTSAFAAEIEHSSTSLNSKYTLELGGYLDIQKISEKTTATVTFDDNYADLNLSEALSSTFKVYTNDAEQKLYLYASAGDIGAADAPALYGTKDALKLIFANTSSSGGSVKATAQDILDVASSPTTSKNAFALALTTASATKSTDAPNGATDDPSVSFSGGVVTYTMTNGIYDFNYATALKSVDNSFNTYDTLGTYTATLTLSKSSI